MFPLGAMDAAISPNRFVNKISINGIHPFFDAISERVKETNSERMLETLGHAGNSGMAFFDFKLLGGLIEQHTPKNPFLEQNRPNVVVIVMESFGSDLLKYNSPSFNVMGELKKHFDEDYVFYNFLSSDIGTIGSLESFFFNMPKRPGVKAISQSKYAFVKHASGAALPYKKAGYETIFAYGGSAGWRNLDSMLNLQGFDTVDGDGAMPKDSLSNEWGVYDEYLFDYIYSKLSNKDGKPKFMLVMTTTNHPPYELPPLYQPLPLNIPMEVKVKITGEKKLAAMRFLTYQYSNQKVGELITKIKGSELGSNTVIVVTGDHNFWDVFSYDYDRYSDLYGVPFYLYAPKAYLPSKKIDTSECGSHIDIMPTIYNLSLSDADYISLGHNMLDDSLLHIGINSDGFIISKHSIMNNAAEFFVWGKNKDRILERSQDSIDHQRMLGYYKDAIIVSDTIIKNPERNSDTYK
jgi:phosphoglycerol transferase MdoB-like AlkP superfamily enzyme